MVLRIVFVSLENKIYFKKLGIMRHENKETLYEKSSLAEHDIFYSISIYNPIKI